MLHRLVESEAEFLQQLSPEVRERVLTGDIPVIRQARPEPPVPQPRLPPGAALALIPEFIGLFGGFGAGARAPITVGRRVGSFLRRIEIAANPHAHPMLRQRIQRQVEQETPQFLENIKPVIQRDPGFLFEILNRLGTARESLTGPLARQVDRIMSVIRGMVVEITPQGKVVVEPQETPTEENVARMQADIRRRAEALRPLQPTGSLLIEAVRRAAGRVTQMIRGQPTRPRAEETIETMMQAVYDSPEMRERLGTEAARSLAQTALNQGVTAGSLRSFGQMYRLDDTTSAELRAVAEASRLLGRDLTVDDVRTYFPPLLVGVLRSRVRDNPEREELLAHAAAYVTTMFGESRLLPPAMLRLFADRPHLFRNRDSVEAFVDAARETMDSLIRSGTSERDAIAIMAENINWVSRQGASGETP
jgi:hypothetical protein